MTRDPPVFATGAWLGAAQVSLGFAMLVGIGASAVVYFALLAGWIAAGAIGAAARPHGRLPLAVALVALLSTRALSAVVPFGAVTILVALAACIACGSYAGAFIAHVGSQASDPRRVLLRENNGFVVGFAAASVLLYASIHLLDALVAFGGVALLTVSASAPPRPRDRRPSASSSARPSSPA